MPRILGKILLLTSISVLGSYAFAHQPHARWSASVPDQDTNNSVQGGCPIESRDGLSIFMASGRAGGFGANDIWVADRPSVDEPFGEATNIGEPINSAAADFCPSPTGGRYLLFVSTRSGGCGAEGDGTGDMYISRRSPAGGWSDPKNLGCGSEGPNTTGAEFSPSLLETRHGTFLFYSSNGYGESQDIRMSLMDKKGNFGPSRAVRGLNTEYDDRMPTVSQDGLEIVFSSDRPTWKHGTKMAAGGQDVYIARRNSLWSRWSEPVNLSVKANFSTKAASETRASFSWDGKRLHYGSAGEIYVSHRKPPRGKKHRHKHQHKQDKKHGKKY